MDNKTNNILPLLQLWGEATYDIDDVDGLFYMLDSRMSGCLVLPFSKSMNEAVPGKITCDGIPLKKYVLFRIGLMGNNHMLGIYVRDAFQEHDREYKLLIEGFEDTEGNVMEPQTIRVKTLAKKMPDSVYFDHDNIALEAAREGMVMLKNEGNLLPLKPDREICAEGLNIFRLGAVGAGKINPRYNIGLRRAIEEYSSFQLSQSAETGIFVISRPSGENQDNNAVKGQYYLTEEEEEALADMTKCCKNTIAILNAGYPMDVRWVEKYGIQAVIWCGYAGMLGGKALVEILDGRVTPSGKLPDTWSLDYFDIPASANFFRVGDGEPPLTADTPSFINTYYEEDIYVGYRYFETFQKPVAYPFGFGLSYTSFLIDSEYSDLKVKGKVKNTGSTFGKETVQVYVKIPESKLEQPDRRLVGFYKTGLLYPGQEENFEVPILKNWMTSFDTETACWIMEKGSYEFFAGNSVQSAVKCGEMLLAADEVIKKSDNLMKMHVKMDVLSKGNPDFPKGLKSGIQKDVSQLTPKAMRRSYPEKTFREYDIVNQMTVEELARLSICASHGWGMHEKGEAGSVCILDNYDMPSFIVADGNNGVNMKRPNIGMPCSNTVCATFNTGIAYEIGRVIAEEAIENDVQMILAPAMNIHRNPLNGRHPEYFSEDPYLAGMMAGHQGKGLEEHGVSSCFKHVAANNCESSRKRNQSIITERALREIYLRVFEVAFHIYQPDSIMTAYNAVNGVFTSEDEELIQGIFRNEFGFEGFAMTDWGSYDTADIVAEIQAGNCWITPGSTDMTYVQPIIDGVKDGRIRTDRLRSNVRSMLHIIEKRTGKAITKKMSFGTE